MAGGCDSLKPHAHKASVLLESLLGDSSRWPRGLTVVKAVFKIRNPTVFFGIGDF